MTIAEVYRKYKHFDILLSDERTATETLRNIILYDLWQAIKEEVEGKCSG